MKPLILPEFYAEDFDIKRHDDWCTSIHSKDHRIFVSATRSRLVGDDRKFTVNWCALGDVDSLTTFNFCKLLMKAQMLCDFLERWYYQEVIADIRT